MNYDFLTSYSSFDYSCRLANGASIHCKYDMCYLYEDEKLLLFSIGGNLDPSSRLIVDQTKIENIEINSISNCFDVVKLKHHDEDIVLYCHK